MREQQLNRLLNLIKKTNDRLVVLDQKSDFVTVMLPLDDYEDLIGEQTDPDWIEPDPELTDLKPESGPSGSEESIPEINDDFGPENSTPEEALGELEKAERADEEEVHGKIPEYVPGKKTLDFSENWASENTQPLSEESLDDVPEEEEKFYLEPVE